MSKKSGYKYRIEQELLKKDWEIITIGSNTIWWDDEHWKISLKYNSDVTFYLCFIVDPMFEGKESLDKEFMRSKHHQNFQQIGMMKQMRLLQSV